MDDTEKRGLLSMPTIIFCKGYYEKKWTFSIISVYLLMLMLMSFNVYSIYTIYIRRRKFPFRQRAPLLALLHTVCYLLVIAVPYLAELLKAFRIVDWGSYNETDPDFSVPMSRRLLKFVLAYARISIPHMAAYRILVVWCMWKQFDMRQSKWFWFIHILGNEKKALIIGITAYLLFDIGTRFGEIFIFNIPGLDWYKPSLKLWYQLFPYTLVRMSEGYFAFWGMYLVRNFPDDLKIQKEYLMINFVNFTIDWFYELKRKFDPSPGEDSLIDCFFFDIKTEYFGDLVRSMLFSLILAYACSVQKVDKVPPERMAYLNEFCFDIQCLETFRSYLRKVSPSELEHFDDTIWNVVQNPRPSVSNTHHEFEGKFQDFQKTVAFKTLKKMRILEERVASIGYASDT